MQDQVQKALTLVGLVLDGKFTLTACIGIGGSGAVYRADQLALGRTVAVKVLNEDLCADPRMITRFRGEATSASSLNHPNCVSIIDYGRTPDGLLYLAMEYVKGPTLTQLVQNESPLATDRVVDIVCQALAGIEEAHLAGVVHADLKSDNIIVDQRRAGVDKVKIVDFGIARLVTGVREIEDRSISGTPEYMAPELISGAPPSFASDIYAVGIILYELLAQQTPFFAGTTTEILTAHLKSSPKQLTARRRDIPRELDAVISKALAKHPADRYASAAAMREALGAIRTRLLQLPVADSCLACGTSVAPTFKFCPECGTPRRRISRTLEVATVTEPSRVFPLPLTGRSDALGTLLEHLRGDPGPRRALLLVGREGAGRSTLLRAAYGELVAAGRVIYQVSPDPSGLASPFYPIRSLIAAILQLPAASSELELREAVLAMDLHERDVPAIAQLFGHPTTLLELEPAVRFRELVWSTLRALERAAAAGPIAIVCEDVDRFDVPSLEILRRAAGSAELALPAMVLTTTKAAAEQWPAATRLELGPLAEDSLAAMVRSLPATGEPPLPTAQQLLETTEGYPGHVEHVIRYLIEGGKVEDTRVSLPDLVAARLSMLAQPTRDVLQAASALGIEPPLDLLRSMLPTEALDPALADAEQRGMLCRDASGELAFTSRLVREIVYDATPVDVRRSLHASAAEAVSAMTGDVALLGHHHDLAGNAREAIDLLRTAGEEAAAQLDERGAGEFFRRTLVAIRKAVKSGDIEDGADQQFVAMSVRLADALRERGETALARGILAEATGWSSSPLLLAQIDGASAAIALSEGDVEAAIGTLRRGIGRAIGGGDLNLVCELYLDLAAALQRADAIDAAHRELEECVDLVTLGEGVASADAPDAFWRVLRAQAQLVDPARDTQLGMRLGEAALFHAQRVHSRLGAARVLQLLANLCDKAGLGDQAERHRQAAITEMRGLGDRRATAELLLSDTPTRGAVVMSSRIQDAVELTREIGWAEGHERAKRKSNPPPDQDR